MNGTTRFWDQWFCRNPKASRLTLTPIIALSIAIVKAALNVAYTGEIGVDATLHPIRATK